METKGLPTNHCPIHHAYGLARALDKMYCKAKNRRKKAGSTMWAQHQSKVHKFSTRVAVMMELTVLVLVQGLKMLGFGELDKATLAPMYWVIRLRQYWPLTWFVSIISPFIIFPSIILPRWRLRWAHGSGTVWKQRERLVRMKQVGHRQASV